MTQGLRIYCRHATYGSKDLQPDCGVPIARVDFETSLAHPHVGVWRSYRGCGIGSNFYMSSIQASFIATPTIPSPTGLFSTFMTSASSIQCRWM